MYVAKYPNDSIQGVFTLADAKLNGAAATLFEKGHLQSLVFYAKAARHGTLRIWNENGQRVLYAEYKNGKNNGLVYLFREGVPWLIKEFDKGVAQSEYLIKIDGDGFRILTDDEMRKEDFMKGMVDAISQLGALEETLNENEATVKRELADWFRKEESPNQTGASFCLGPGTACSRIGAGGCPSGTQRCGTGHFLEASSR